MLTIFAVIAGGIILGRLLSNRNFNFLPRLITCIIWTLLFLLGLEVGSNPEVIRGMGTLGLTAFLIFLSWHLGYAKDFFCQCHERFYLCTKCLVHAIFACFVLVLATQSSRFYSLKAANNLAYDSAVYWCNRPTDTERQPCTFTDLFSINQFCRGINRDNTAIVPTHIFFCRHLAARF